ncbi:hypothetical protein P9209_13935 [Prescottella defluvii]|nr:hypothetical protein P9209_13935 [Prescottella defluvii]
MLGYISTWSAVRRAIDAGREDVLEAFATDLTDLWGDAPTARAVTWPVNMRVGKIRWTWPDSQSSRRARSAPTR